MPAVLQKLMRHESIDTTMGVYVELDADELADDLYRAHERGTVSGTVAESNAVSEEGVDAANHLAGKGLQQWTG